MTVSAQLPISPPWNGRFVALGGGGFSASAQYSPPPYDPFTPFTSQGYAVATTDAGVSIDAFSPATWALLPNGSVNLQLLENFASRSLHDLAVTGKALTAAFYGKEAEFTYWNGCSTGGRQGMTMAQKYPEDFDGILAGAPAISWEKFVVGGLWPQVVMKEEGYFPSPCELDAVTQAAIAACDSLDGVKDEVITDLASCHFDPSTLVGQVIQCDGSPVTISDKLASIVKQIWEGGPRTPDGTPLWSGLNVGAPLDWAGNTTLINGTRVGVPFSIAATWVQYFLEQDPSFDTATITPANLTSLFYQSIKEYADIIGTEDPDLSGLRDAKAKLLHWHGEADQLVFTGGSVAYRQKVEALMGGGSKVDDFYRLFLAPGVDHCGGGLTAGAVPSDPFGALVRWVENGTAPEHLDASTLPGAETAFTRKVCRYPLIARYNGYGNTSVEESFECAGGYGEE